MPITDNELQTIDRLLKDGTTLREIATELDVQYHTLYAKIRRRGYKLDKRACLVPISAKPIRRLARGSAIVTIFRFSRNNTGRC